MHRKQISKFPKNIKAEVDYHFIFFNAQFLQLV